MSDLTERTDSACPRSASRYGVLVHRFTVVLLSSALACGALVATDASSASTTTDKQVVLGSSAFAKPAGSGFGTPHPSSISNGGDPSGLVTNIHWTGWGARVADGTGLNAILQPQGGYYAQRVTIELRASSLGRCTRTGPRAYQELDVREPSRPGGRVGPWFRWSGHVNLCHSGSG